VRGKRRQIRNPKASQIAKSIRINPPKTEKNSDGFASEDENDFNSRPIEQKTQEFAMVYSILKIPWLNIHKGVDRNPTWR